MLPSAANWASSANPSAFAGVGAAANGPPGGAPAARMRLPAPPSRQAANATPVGPIAAVGKADSNPGVDSA